MKSTKTSHVYLAQRIRQSWSTVILYPCAMLITWMPSTIFACHIYNLEITDKELPHHHKVIQSYLDVGNVLYGPLLALIFYTKTLDARRAWIYNFRCILYVLTDVDMDDRSTCTSIISIEDSQVVTSGLWQGNSQLMHPFNIHNQQVNPISSVVRISEQL